MINHLKIFLSFILASLVLQVSAQNNISVKLEKTIRSAINKAYPASVKIMGFDTVKKIQNSSQFSGSIVTAEGHILTAAHAIKPNNIYKVSFPDGRECLAVGLGRIALTGTQTLPDVAMMKIITKGKWPYVEMGWSSTLKVDEPCISIAYPEALGQKLPLVRFGRVSNIAGEAGFIESTCAMELGDSGGALYDYNGRLIGIHSRCLKTEEINQEVPIDLFRKYWAALNEPVNYTELPGITDEIKTDPIAAQIYGVPELKDLAANLSKQAAKFSNTQFVVTSQLKNAEQKILATLVVADGWKSKKFELGSMLISKSSCIGKEPIVLTKSGPLKARIIFRNTADDLVLLMVDQKLNGGIKISKTETDSLNFNQLGTLLLSPRPDTLPKASVLGSTNLGLALKYSMGYLGATSIFKDGKVEIYKIQPGSPANIFSLSVGDKVGSINGQSINILADLQRELGKYEPGDKVNIVLNRSGRDTAILVMLASKPVPVPNHNAEKFPGGKSKRRDGFEKVFGHDARIRPEECGGPVVDTKGEFYGINIARFSRVVTLVMPVNQIRRFLQSALGDDNI